MYRVHVFPFHLTFIVISIYFRRHLTLFKSFFAVLDLSRRCRSIDSCGEGFVIVIHAKHRKAGFNVNKEVSNTIKQQQQPVVIFLSSIHRSEFSQVLWFDVNIGLLHKE